VRGGGLSGGGRPVGTCEDLLEDPLGALLDAGPGRAGSLGWPTLGCPGTGFFARHMRLLPGRDPGIGDGTA
jgi:hypothetical protein